MVDVERRSGNPNSLFSKVFAIIVPFLLFNSLLLAQSRISLPVKIKIEDGSTEEVTVIMKNLTTGETNEVPGAQRVDLELKINNNYIVSFTKAGYITKRISFDARMPIARSAQELYPFNFEVILFPQYEGLNVVVFNQPVAKIFFNPLLDDFDYDTDYTKQIQSALKKAEEEIAERQKEERKKVAENKKLEQQRLAEENRKNKEAERLRVEEEKRQKAEEEKLKREEARNQKAAEDQRRAEARASQGADQRARNSQLGSDMPASSINGSSGGDGRQPAVVGSGIDGVGGVATGSAGGSSKPHSSVSAGEDVQAASTTAMSSGADDKSEGLPKVTEGKDVIDSKKASAFKGNDDRPVTSPQSPSSSKKSVETAPSQSLVAPSVKAQMSVEEYQENGKRVIKVTYDDPSEKLVFMKVIYDWGGVYYFKSGRYISQAYFQSSTGIQ